MDEILIIHFILLTVGWAALLVICSLISRRIQRTEEKIGELEHTIRSTDDYIKYTKHTTDVVYLNYLDGLERILIKEERYEEVEKIRRVKHLVEKRMQEYIEEYIRR